MTFLKVNAAEYADNVKLFKLAREKYGHVDHALAIAGVAEKDTWFGADLTVEDVETPEQNRTIDINVLGVLYFIRVALPYLRLDNKDGKDKSLVLAGSAAGFRDTPDLPVYNASKHAVQGIMRGLRKRLWENDKIRINVFNPGVVDTNMANTLATTFRKAGLPVNMPEDIAGIILRFMTETDVWGKSVYCDGGKGWEWETGYRDTMSTWLGEEPVRRLKKAVELVASVRNVYHARAHDQVLLILSPLRVRLGTLTTQRNRRHAHICIRLTLANIETYDDPLFLYMLKQQPTVTVLVIRLPATKSIAIMISLSRDTGCLALSDTVDVIGIAFLAQ